MAGIELPERYGGVEPSGEGAMGTVYRAFDAELQRPVAIKVLADRYAADADIRERFRREAQTAARLTGAPHTVGVLDAGTASGRPYIVLEYLPGGSIADRLAEGGSAREDALRWIDQAGQALDTAHARGVVHRDVKPANLLLDGTADVHISDFGIARAIDDATITSTGTVLGSAGYLSPEQARGEAATEASDRYALAVVAFELLSGRRPFERDSGAAEAFAHAHSAPPGLSETIGEPPSPLDGVFERALAKDPARRYPSCAAFAAALRDAAAGAAETIPLGATAVLARPDGLRRRRVLVGTVVVALLAAGIATGLGLTADRRTADSTPSTRIVRKTVTETVSTPPRTVRVPVAAAGAPVVVSATGKRGGKHANRHGRSHGPGKHGHR